MISDHERHELYVTLTDRLGAAPADTLMALLPPVGWVDVARRSDVDNLGIALRGEMAELRSELKGEMAEFRSELKGEMAEFRSELKGEFAAFQIALRGEFGEFRSEMRGQLPKLIAANIASAIGVAGLVLTAAHFA